MLKLWKFEEAPKEYQTLSTNGGDEDWVIWSDGSDPDMPAELADKLAICDYEIHYVSDGVIAITNHG